MAKASVGAIRIIDGDGDACDDGSGKLSVNATLVAGATIDIGDVEITGHATIGHGSNTDVSSSTAERIDSGIVACKHMDIMAAIANTGKIYVGASGVTATTGITLYPGDVYSVDIDNTGDVYVLAEVNNEDVQWTYYV